jgi:hypothetical protein
MLQQRRLPQALGRVAEALLLLQSLPLLEQTIRQILRHEEMAPRYNACRVMMRVPDAARASKQHQPEHKQLAQCGSGEQSAALLQTDVDAVHVPLLRVSLRRSATAAHDLPALHAASRRPAVQGMRRELGDECRVMALEFHPAAMAAARCGADASQLGSVHFFELLASLRAHALGGS